MNEDAAALLGPRVSTASEAGSLPDTQEGRHEGRAELVRAVRDELVRVTHTDGAVFAEPPPEPRLGETLDCKAPGCPREARWTRGRYAYLCEVHADEKKAETKRPLDEILREASGELGPPVDPDHVTGALTAAVRELVPVTEQLEKTIEARRLARRDALKAVEAFNDALRRVREQAQQLLLA